MQLPLQIPPGYLAFRGGGGRYPRQGGKSRDPLRRHHRLPGGRGRAGAAPPQGPFTVRIDLSVRGRAGGGSPSR
jgi:hypothetical protein